MVGALVFDKDAGLRQGISQVGSALAGAINQRTARSQEAEQRKKYGTILSETLSGIKDNSSPMELVGSISSMLEKGVPVEYLKGIMPLIEPQIKGSIQGEQNRSFLEKMGLNQPEGPQGAPGQPVIPNQPQPDGQPSPMGMQPQGQPQGQPRGQDPLGSLSDTQLIAMEGSGIPQAKDIAIGEMKRRDLNQKNFRSDRDFAYKKSAKFFDKLEEEADRLADQKEAISNMENAINEGNTEFFSKDNFANYLGKYGEGLRTSKGAQLLNAQKEFLVADLGRVGARPNQWIEEQISRALTKIGRSDEANLTIVEALKARVSRGEAKQEISRNLENYYLEKDGTIPANFTNIVREAMRPVEIQIQEKLSYKLRQYHERENSGNLRELMNKKVSVGTPLTIEMASLFLDKYGDKERAIKNAKARGYVIPTPQEYRRFME